MEYLKLILNSSLISGLAGSIVGGIITWLITRNSLKKQFQNRLAKSEQIKKDKVALKSLIQEQEINLEVVNDYVTYAEANGIERIDTKNKKFIATKQNSWETFKGDMLLLNNGLYCDKIIKNYKSFFMLDTTDGIVLISEAKRIVTEINDLLSELNKYNNEIELTTSIH